MNVLWLRQDAIDRRNEAAARFPAHFTPTRISAESAFIFSMDMILWSLVVPGSQSVKGDKTDYSVTDT